DERPGDRRRAARRRGVRAGAGIRAGEGNPASHGRWGGSHMTGFVKIHSPPDNGTALVLKGVLEAAGVPCHINDPGLYGGVIENDSAETLDGFVPAQLDGIDVFVPTEFEPRARELLRQEGFAAGFDVREVDSFFDEKVAPALRGGEHLRGPLVADLGAEAR